MPRVCRVATRAPVTGLARLGLVALLCAAAAGADTPPGAEDASAAAVATAPAHPPSTVPSGTAATPAAHPPARIAIATAFAPEFDALAPRLRDIETTRRNGVTFLAGTLAGRGVVLFQTGISIVNATMTTQLALALFEIEEIVVSGIAAGVDPELAIGDVIVPIRWGKYDEMIYLREAEDPVAALPPGIAPEFPPFEFMGPRGMPLASADSPSPRRRFWYEADGRLLASAREAAGAVALERCYARAGVPDCLPRVPRILIGGSGVSGSVFLDNARFRRYLDATFDAQVAEMETAAIAMVAHANGVPFIAFRSVSDLAGGEPHVNEMGIFMGLAAENAARFVEGYLAARAHRR